MKPEATEFDSETSDSNPQSNRDTGPLIELISPSSINPSEYDTFSNYKKNLFLVTAESLFWIFSGLLFVSLLLQFVIYSDAATIRNAVLLRAYVLLIILGYLLSIRNSEFVRDRVVFFTSLGISVAYAIAGYFTGRIAALESFFAYAYYAPCIAILMPVNLYPRIFITFLFPGSYLLAYLYSEPGLSSTPTFPQQLISFTVLCFLCVLIGHMFFYLFRQNFFYRRQAEQQQEELQYMATHDQLTGLYNRRFMENRLEEEFERATRYDRQLSVLMIDLDHFKQINDTYGHRAGDRVLEFVGELINHTLENSVRRCDIGGRFGGEEFLLVLPETNLQGAQKVAKRIRETLAEEEFTSPEGESFSVTCSVGGASFGAEHESPETLVQEADSSLYEAKEAGRNQVVLQA